MRLWRVTIPRRALWVAAPAASALVGAALVVFLMRGPFSDGGRPQEEVVTVPTVTATARLLPSPAPPSDALPDRLWIPEIDVDAPLETQTVSAEGILPMPSGPEVVAVYDLDVYHPGQEDRVGFGGNAIFSGHVDYIDYGPAVFWDLSELEPGDRVLVLLEDGTAYQYAVVWNERWPLTDIPWDRIFGVNGHDAVTLVTCAGSWDGHEYSDRRAVRAEQVLGPFPAPSS